MFKKKGASRLYRTAIVTLAFMVMIAFSGVANTNVFAASKLKVSPSSKTLNVGQTVKLKANKGVKWTVVKGKKYVKIYSKTSKTVKVKALKSGTATIKAKAKSGGKTKSIKVTVVPKLSVSPSSVKLSTGQSKTLTANNSVKWSVSSGSSYISLSSAKSKSVKVNGNKAGSGYVMAKNTKTGSYKKVKVVVSTPAATEAQLDKVLSGEDTETTLIDARDSDAYAGWALGEATKGGHFKDAINLDSSWIGNKKMDAMLTDNGMSAEKSYIVYDTNGKDAKAITEYLISMGYKNVAAINAADKINGSDKLVSYDNYDLTVPASVVKNISDNVTNGTELNDAAKAVVGDSKNIVILECSWGAPEDTNYVTGHVPGAYHIDTNETDPPGTYVEADNERYLMDYKYEWRLNSDENLIKLFASRNITKDSCVIVTGKSAAPVSRCGILAKYVGVDNVHIMSKGYTGWNNEGYDMETTNRNAALPNGPEAIAALSDDMFTKFGSSTVLNPGIYEKTDYVKSHIGTDGYQLVDNRRDAEWNGLTPNYDYEDLAGRIDGSIHSTQNSYNPDNSMRSKSLQDAKWTGDGIDLSQHMVFFCGDGWRAAVDTWNAWVLGYDASIYHGWMEWSNSGCDFINKDGDKVHYDKDQQAVVNSETGKVVQKLHTKLEFEKKTVSVGSTGTYKKLSTLYKHEDMTGDKAPVFSSSNEELITVDQNGVVTVEKMPEQPTDVTIKAEVKGYVNNAGPEDREASYVISLAANSAAKVAADSYENTQDDYVSLDVRTAVKYDAGHIKGSESCPVYVGKDDNEPTAEEAEANIEEAVKANGKDAQYMLICNSGAAYAEKASLMLMSEGVDADNIKILEGGFNNWSKTRPFVVGAEELGNITVYPADKKVTLEAEVNDVIHMNIIDDQTHHFVVNKKGTNGTKCVLPTDALPYDVYNALKLAGGTPEDNCDNAKNLCAASHENGTFLQMTGSKVDIDVTWEDNGKSVTKGMGEVLKRTGEHADEAYDDTQMEFAGCADMYELNWDKYNVPANFRKSFGSDKLNMSGCITCTFSCWIGTCSNGAYGYNSEEVVPNRDVLPAPQTPVVVTYQF